MPDTRAKLSVKFTLERLRAQASEQSKETYPGDHHGPKKWLALVMGLLDTADDCLGKTQRPALQRPEIQALIRDAADLCGLAYRCLSFMRGATAADLPYPIARPLQRWFDQVGVDRDAFFRAEAVVNYEIRPQPQREFNGIKNQSPSLQKAIADIKWPVLRVTVPAKAFGILPHYAIVAHEIGHALYPKITWNITPDPQALAALIQGIRTRLNVTVLNANARTLLQKTYLSWVEELAADAIAFRLTGPAAFFSLGEFFELLSGGYGLGIYHPANDLRRKILFDRISAGQGLTFADIFRKHTGQELTEDFNSSLLVATPDKNQIFLDLYATYSDTEVAAVLSELHDFIPSIVDQIYVRVDDHLQTNAADAIYSVSRFNDDLTKHLEAMLVAIPPIEDRVQGALPLPTEFASILNVGWVVLLTKLRELRVKTRSADALSYEKLERLHGLILKAVELSEARRQWEAT